MLRDVPLIESEDEDGGSSQDNVPQTLKQQHVAAYSYKIRLEKREEPVCVKAFCGFHGITYERVRRLQKHLFNTGTTPKDKRGKHLNRPNKTAEDTLNLIRNHIKSFKNRQSHYSRRKNPNTYYLPETLNVKKMYKIFVEEHPSIKSSYRVYWKIFYTEFNLKFGLPRSDTCGTCDRYQSKLLTSCDDPEERKKINIEKELHLIKAEKFYAIKKKYKLKARADPENFTCVSFDYMQNLPMPHIRTNAVFYARQLWLYVFGVHNDGGNTATMFSYDETIGRKGQNEVASLLFHYLRSNDVTTTNLILISDGCAGQNKNYVLMKFLYLLVHGLHMFKSITHVFPIRGHSFLSCDQDFSLIEKHKKTETVEMPKEWENIIKHARNKPSPFTVTNVDQSMIFNILDATAPFFLKSARPPVKIKTARMLRYSIDDAGVVLVRQTYTGNWEKSLIRNKRAIPNEFEFKPLYNKPIDIPHGKKENLKDLTQYLTKAEAKNFYSRLLVQSSSRSDQNTDLDEDDNSSGISDED